MEQNMNDNIPELKIEFEDGTGDGVIVLEQDCCGNVERVAIHQIHLRYMAEKCGLIATSDPQAQRTIAMLTRRLNLLRDRIDHLGERLTNHPDHEHADLSYECTYVAATADIADEFCADLDRPHLATLPDTPAASPEIPKIGDAA
jgi:hypothetical protein